MVKNISINFHRKTKVPTKRQIYHMFRSDWKLLYRVNQDYTRKMFKVFGEGGVIETDSQMCYFILKHFGVGEYMLIAWQEKRRGFYNFFKVEIQQTMWRRLPKVDLKEDREKKEFRQEVAMVRKRNKDNEEGDSAGMKEEIDFLKEIYSMGDNDEKRTNSGPFPYLKQTHPIYRFHAYEKYEDAPDDNIMTGDYW